MDSIFLLDEGARTNYLHHLMISSGCNYICLWTYLPQPSNCLILMDGLYNEESNQASSSSSSYGTTLARRLFDQYRHSVFPLQNDTVPGLAFKNNRPYVELKDSDLRRLASIEAQLQFYQEARIKTAIFMGCKTGEIELGMSNDPQVNLEMEMRNWFAEDFSRQNNPPSSSSSSLRSLSMDSPECSPFLFNILSNSYIQEPPKEASIHHQTSTPIPTTTNPLQEAMQTLNKIRNVQFPTIEYEEAAMAKAMLAVISSSSASPSSSSHRPPRASAFKNYRSSLAPSTGVTARVRQQNMVKRAIAFFRSLNLMRSQDQQVQGNRPTSNQLHHMISERRRREKLNESFQALRSLLPPGSKKDKASVLSSTTDYMNSLKAKIEELTQRNKFLEGQLSPQKEATGDDQFSGTPSNERINVQIRDILESTSEARTIDLQVNVRGECSLLDLAIRVMEFLKQVENVNVISVEANTMNIDSNNPINHVVLRLKIEGSEWDESAFQEAVRRVVADLAQ